jgi:hypothetical protein
MYRLFANILALISLFILPLWCTIVFLIIISFFFDFVEIVAYGFVTDLVYGLHGSFIQSNIFILSSIGLYGIILLVKPYIKL